MFRALQFTLALALAVMSTPAGEFDAKDRIDQVFSLPAKGAVNYYKGRLLAVDITDGRAQIAADAANLIVVGKIDATRLNEDGAHGDLIVPYNTGTFLYRNSATHPVTQAHYARPVFVEDDITVGTDPGTHNVFAGFFRGFSNISPGVWIDTRPLPLIAAFFGNNPANNWRLSADPDTGASVLQLWNQDQDKYQTIQLAGAAGFERLVIEA